MDTITTPTATTMANPPPTLASFTSPSGAPRPDQTFRKYTATQAASYQAGRAGYPDALNQMILAHHTSTGGQLGTLLDVGCGPGTATRTFAPYFSCAFGLDSSVEMINTTRAIPSSSSSSSSSNPVPIGPPPGTQTTKTAQQQQQQQQPPVTAITFAPSTAEEIPGPALAASSALPPGSVDLLTVATAAHWFDMSRFWPRAASLVAPGGTVALWTSAGYYCHPHTTPHAARVQAVLDRLESERLASSSTPGNEVNSSLYRQLGMPWPAVPEFPEALFVRREWNVGGKVEPGERFLRGREVASFKDLATGLATVSMVTRWREAHPDLAGTDEDVIAVTIRELREALGGQEWLESGSAAVLLMFKRR